MLAALLSAALWAGLLLLVLATGLVVYHRLIKYRGYKLPPSPPSDFLRGHHTVFDPAARADLMATFTKFAQQYGTVYHLDVGPALFKLVIVSDPQLVKETLRAKELAMNPLTQANFGKYIGPQSLVALDGDLWKLHRRIITPIFYQAQLKRFTKCINECCTTFLNILDKKLQEKPNSSVEFGLLLKNLTLDAMGRAAFSQDLGMQGNSSEAKTLGTTVEVVLDHIAAASFAPFPKLREWLHPIEHREYMQSRQVLNGVVDRLVSAARERMAARKAEEKDKPAATTTADNNSQEVDEDAASRLFQGSQDLLDMLLAARDEGGQGLDSEGVRDEIVTFLFGGFETTTSTTMWLLHHLCTRPQVQQKICEEIDRVVGGREPNFDDVQKLDYLQACANESARLTPAAGGFGRGVGADMKVGGYDVPKGSVIIFCGHAIQHDPKYWPEPEEFKPERWLDLKRPVTYEFIPFGGGARACVGRRFAEMEIIQILVRLFQRYTVSLDQAAPFRIEFKVTGAPRIMSLFLHKRK